MPSVGVLLFKQISLTADSPSKRDSGLLLPSSQKEETIMRGTVLRVNDPENFIKEGEQIVLDPEDVLGTLQTDDGLLHTALVKDILGKVVG
jgi:co-chaperonin GroES (HSP10)